jgi:hypothetical protein
MGYGEAFGDWVRLARTDPAAFESLRRGLIDNLIAEAPEERRTRLRCVQWRIDQERARAQTPLGACLRVSRMMWDSVLGGGGLVEQLHQLSDPPAPARPLPAARTPARVLPFRPRSDQGPVA